MKEKSTLKHVVIVKSLVVNDSGEILFVKRKWEERPELHGKWEFPGGKLEYLEQPEQTAKREAKEETGYNVEVKALLPKLLSFSKVFEGINCSLTLICYLCKLIGGEKSMKDHGVSDVRWFKPDEVPKESDCLSGTSEYINVYRSLMQNKP